MTGKASRRKGHDFERWVARKFNEIDPSCKAQRGLQYRDGAEAPDVLLPNSTLHIECKRQKQPNIRAALQQAIYAGGDESVPIAITKADQQPALCTMRFEDWLKMWSAISYQSARLPNREGK